MGSNDQTGELDQQGYIGPERRLSGVSGTGVQYLPGHVEEFVDYVIDKSVPDFGEILDLGGGGLRFAIPVALRNKEVTVIDLDADSLNVEAIVSRVNKIGKLNLNLAQVSRLIHTEAADVIHFLENRSKQFSLITAFRLIVYFSPEEVATLFSLMKDALIPEGRLVVSGLSPYNHNNPDDLNEIFTNMSAVGDEPLYCEFNDTEVAKTIRTGQNLPERLHFSDTEFFRRHATRAGLKVLESDLASTRMVNGYILARE